MNNEKWTVSLNNGNKSHLHGNVRGNELNDLDKIADVLNTDVNKLLNSEIIRDIKVEQIKIRHWSWIDGIQFSYRIPLRTKFIQCKETSLEAMAEKKQ